MNCQTMSFMWRMTTPIKRFAYCGDTGSCFPIGINRSALAR